MLQVIIRGDEEKRRKVAQKAIDRLVCTGCGSVVYDLGRSNNNSNDNDNNNSNNKLITRRGGGETGAPGGR